MLQFDDNGKSQLFTSRLEMIELILQPWNGKQYQWVFKTRKGNQDTVKWIMQLVLYQCANKGIDKDKDKVKDCTKIKTKIKIKLNIVPRQRQR